MRRNWNARPREIHRVAAFDKILGWVIIAVVVVSVFAGFLALAGQAAPF